MSIRYTYKASATLDEPPRSRSAGETTTQATPARGNTFSSYTTREVNFIRKLHRTLPVIELFTSPPNFSIFDFQYCCAQYNSNINIHKNEAKFIWSSRVHTCFRVRRPARDTTIPSNGFFGEDISFRGRLLLGFPRFLISYENIQR